MPPRYEADDPREWLSRARSNLARAAVVGRGIYLEDACFDAQQAAEKAIKAVFIHRRLKFPYIHDLRRLVNILEDSGEPIPDPVREAVRLTPHAVAHRYPTPGNPVSPEDHIEAVKIATDLVAWATDLIHTE